MIEAIKNATPGQVIWDNKDGDASVPGLHVRVFSNRKDFYLYYKTRRGTERRPKLGKYPLFSLADARKVAKAILLRVSAGEDPGAEWKNAREEATMAELFQLVWDGHWSKPRFQKSKWAKEVKRNWEKHLKAAFGHVRVSEMTAASVRNWHSTLENNPYAANRSLEALSKLFSYAIEQEWKCLPACVGGNPCALVKAHPEKKRKRVASFEEIKKIGTILEREREKNPREVAFIYLLMLSGSRPKFIVDARPEHLSVRDGVGFLTLHGKSSAATGDDETVIIPPKALELVQALPPSSTLLGIKMPRAFWDKVRREAGCPDLWARDWRRTFATVGMGEGVNKDILGRVLNHRSSQTTDLYALLSESPKVSTALKIADAFDALLTA